VRISSPCHRAEMAAVVAAATAEAVAVAAEAMAEVAAAVEDTAVAVAAEAMAEAVVAVAEDTAAVVAEIAPGAAEGPSTGAGDHADGTRARQERPLAFLSLSQGGERQHAPVKGYMYSGRSTVPRV